MSARSSVSSTGNVAKIGEATRRLVKQRLLVGIPDSTAARQPEAGEKRAASNAVIGYVQEFGDDARRIPARPFLVPGVSAVKDVIADALRAAGSGAMTGDLAAIDRGFAKAGFAAVTSVKATIVAGPFAPLSERTIEARARRRYADTGKAKGDKASREAREFLKLRAQGTPDAVLHGAGLAQPLLDTRSMFGAITYAVGDR